MNPIKALMKLKGRAARKHAEAEARATLELKREALAILWNKGHSDECYTIINKASNGESGTADYVLRNIIKHLPNYDAYDITQACREASYAKIPETELLTDDFMNVYQQLSEAFLISTGSTKYEIDRHDIEEHQKIISYALTHMEVGPLIVTMVWDRGFVTLESILEFLPIMSDGHTALSDGAL